MTKRACEDLAGIYRLQGLEAVGLRYFTVYGPRQRPDMAIRRLCEAALSRTSFPIYGEGDQIRDFTYVDDVVDATVRAAQADAPPPILNVGGSESATLLHVIETIGELAEHEIELDRRPVQRGDVRRTGADTSLARASLGWEPQVRLTEGLAATVEWARAKSPQAAAESAA
jgi:nucleoside-diphosphate-sugar epimerase